MHPPANPTVRPPEYLQEKTSQLEDPGTDSNDVRMLQDAILSVNAGMQVLQSMSHKLLQASMPRPANMEKPLGGNPFEEKGTFKNEHEIFALLSKGEWVYFEELKTMIGIAEVSVRNKVKSMNSLVGYDLHHHEETDAYCLVRSA